MNNVLSIWFPIITDYIYLLGNFLFKYWIISEFHVRLSEEGSAGFTMDTIRCKAKSVYGGFVG